MLDVLQRDLKQTIRRLVNDWQFSAGAIAILALGIGANTAVFSILNNTLFQPHPFADSGRLVNVYQKDVKSGEPGGVSYPAFLDLQKETGAFQAVTAAQLTEGRYQFVDKQGQAGGVHSGLFEYASAIISRFWACDPPTADGSARTKSARAILWPCWAGLRGIVILAQILMYWAGLSSSEERRSK